MLPAVNGKEKLMSENRENSKDAIIFVPGLGTEAVNQHIDTIARRMAGALERQTASARARFQVVGAPEETYGQVYKTPVRTITAQASGEDKAKPLADIYELDYRDTISKRFRERNPFLKALIMLQVLLAVFPKFLLSMAKPSKSLKEKLQLVFISGIIWTVLIYMAVVITAGIQALEQGPTAIEGLKDGGNYVVTIAKKVPDFFGRTSGKKDQAGSESVSTPGQAQAGSENKEKETPITLVQTLVLIVMSLGLFRKKGFKETVSTIATEFVCVANYLRLADKKPAVLGQAAALLEHIAEKEEPYAGVHIVAFSFGSVVSLDLLFPHSRPGARIETIKSLVSIGCPFDIIRTYWPAYFKDRQNKSNVPEKWVNIYAPLDVFGSNFRNDSITGDAEQGIEPVGDPSVPIIPALNIPFRMGMQSETLSVMDIITVKGAQMHCLYWTGDDEPEASCFDDVAAALFGSDP